MVMIKDDDLFYVGTTNLVVADVLLRLGQALENESVAVEQAKALLQTEQMCACGKNPVCECVPA